MKIPLITETFNLYVWYVFVLRVNISQGWSMEVIKYLFFFFFSRNMSEVYYTRSWRNQYTFEYDMWSLLNATFWNLPPIRTVYKNEYLSRSLSKGTVYKGEHFSRLLSEG